MTEVRAAVTDTHPLVYFIGGGPLGRRAGAHFEACDRQEVLTYVPSIVVWECSLLARAGKVDFGRPLDSVFDDLFTNPAYVPLELSVEQVVLAHDRRPNNDPFDALICAAARSLELPLITRDHDIHASRVVDVLW